MVSTAPEILRSGKERGTLLGSLSLTSTLRWVYAFSSPDESDQSITPPPDVVLRHSLMRRKRRDDVFPLTVGWYQRMAKELGHHVGEHRAAREIKDLLARGVIIRAGVYRQSYSNSIPSGWKVPLYRLAQDLTRRTKRVASIRRPKRVKGQNLRWWEHPLFGTPDGRPPPLLSARLRAWREPRWT